VNDDRTAIARGDVNVIASLLKTWLKELPNPLVPSEMFDLFEEMSDQNKYLGFVERLPQVHQLTLIYLIGFLQEVCHNTEFTGMEKADLAMIFGPCIVNPAKAITADPERIQRITEKAVAFCSRLIEARDPSIVYPLNPVYLQKGAAKRGAKAAQGHSPDEAPPQVEGDDQPPLEEQPESQPPYTVQQEPQQQYPPTYGGQQYQQQPQGYGGQPQYQQPGAYRQ
jgi:hypothetical protein